MANFTYIIIFLAQFYYILTKLGFADYSDYKYKPYTVDYNNREFKIDDKPTIFIGGTIHYPRFIESEWDRTFKLMKSDGLNIVQIDVFWGYHEEYEGIFNWEGDKNVTKFIEIAGQNNLFVNLRLGPYIHGEYNLGGIPIWLKEKGCTLRQNNKVFAQEMSRYIKTVIDKVNHLFCTYGGPIILTQIEHEIHWDAANYLSYIDQLISELNLPIPVLMSNGKTAVSAINTCTGNDCVDFLLKNGVSDRILVDHPAVWTENNMGYSLWGTYSFENSDNDTTVSSRLADEISNSVIRWFSSGGTYMCYNVYIGGNNFGLSPSSSITTMFADDSVYHSDTLPNEPKHTHLSTLNSILSDISIILLTDRPQLNHKMPVPYWDGAKYVNGTQQYAFVYKRLNDKIAFIENNANQNVLTLYNDKELYLMPHSNIIFNMTSNTVLFNTSQSDYDSKTRKYSPITDVQIKWNIWKESSLTKYLAPINNTDVVKASPPYGQFKITKGHTEYQYLEVNVTWSSGGCLTSIGGHLGNGYIFYIDGIYTNDVTERSHGHGPHYPSLTLSNTKGLHRLTIISETLGVDNHFSPDGNVDVGYGLNTLESCGLMISYYHWIQRPYLDGEILQIFKAENLHLATWSNYDHQSYTGGIWMYSYFQVPDMKDDEQLVVDLNGMCRGRLYVNGYDLGRFFLIKDKDLQTPTQRYYYIPKGLILKNADNLIVLFELCLPSDPDTIKFNIAKLM